MKDAVDVLVKFRVSLDEDEVQCIDVLPTSWKELQKRARQYHGELVAVQVRSRSAMGCF